MAVKPEEKRHFPRIKLRTAIRCQIRGRPDSDNALSDNISTGGLSFTTNKFIAPATPVMLEVNILSRILRPVGKVTWATPLPHSDRNRIGVEFSEFNPSERNYLTDYIDMQIKQF